MGASYTAAAPSVAGVAPSRAVGEAVRRGVELTGGTVTLVAPRLVAVSDVDTDRVVFVSVGPQDLGVWGEVQLPERSHPARAALGEGHLLYVALRGSGDVARIDASTYQLLGVSHACAEPRGVTWDEASAVARVACANGDLATVDAEGHVATERWAPDLRDVLAFPDGRLEAVTFRGGGSVTRTGAGAHPLPSFTVPTDLQQTARFVPEVAWRSRVADDGSVVVTHQRAIEGPVSSVFAAPSTTTTTVTDYAGGTHSVTSTNAPCATPVIRSALTRFAPDGTRTSVELPGVLPVDVAVSPGGQEIAVAMAGSKAVGRVRVDQLTGDVATQCASQLVNLIGVPGLTSGVTYLADGSLVVHTLSPSRLTVLSNRPTQVLELSPSPAGGRGLFHLEVNAMACASCHPEGRDDGHVWEVRGARRKTPSLVGGLLDTAPFHWEGEHSTLSAVMADTFVQRMGGAMPPERDVRDLALWLEYLPREAPLDTGAAPDLVAHGQALFEGTAANCTACHFGPALTDNLTRDVGTGGRFQTPSLRGVGAHGPWLHDGRAKTLRERFAASGGGDKHGGVSQLSPGDVDALVAYLQTL
ncbi:MAG: c-type cytochrome [Archangiaceae bacterium]|nr:c-type cytochrome [Archangiaceae bacterium]